MLENSADFPPILSTLLNSPERQSFKLVVQGGKIIELSSLDETPSSRDAGMQEGWISMEIAAKRLAHGYHWMCRNWRGLGLQRRQIGRAIFFRETDIAALIERQRPTGREPGRPRKIVGIIRPQV